MYSLINDAIMPQGMNMPEEFYGMLGEAWPAGFAPGYEADFSGLDFLDQPPYPEVGSFLLSLLESQPELGIALMEAVTGMTQQQGLPFLPLVTGRGEAGTTGLNDFLALLMEGRA